MGGRSAPPRGDHPVGRGASPPPRREGRRATAEAGRAPPPPPRVARFFPRLDESTAAPGGTRPVGRGPPPPPRRERRRATAAARRASSTTVGSTRSRWRRATENRSATGSFGGPSPRDRSRG